MKFTDRLAARFGFVRAGSARKEARAYAAAEVGRLTANLIINSHSRFNGSAINEDLRMGLDRMREVSRAMVRDNEHAKKFKSMVGNGVVGPEGFRLNSTCADSPDQQDQAACSAVELAWFEFCKPANCDVAGKASFAQICKLAVQSEAIDGEFLIRIVRNRGPYGIQLQTLDAARIDTNYNIPAADGRNAIIMGVEVDEYLAAVAYYMMFAGKRERVPATDIIHGFIPTAPEQVRGEPWMHAAIRRLNDLGGYREAAVIAARIGASKMGFFTSPDGDGAMLADQKDSDGTLTTEVSPGQFDTLPTGYDFKTFDPTYPHEQFDAFNKAALRGIASALDVDYNTLNNDLEGVNLSSLRSGKGETRDILMSLQRHLIDTLAERVFSAWIDTALLKGKIVFASGNAAPASKRDKFAAHEFKGRRWGYDDPLKDTMADVEGIKHNITTFTDVCNKRGLDFEDVLATRAKEQKLMAKYNVTDPFAADLTAALDPNLTAANKAARATLLSNFAAATDGA